MVIIRTLLAFLGALTATYVLASAFYTARLLAESAGVGIHYSQAQQIDTYLSNFAGLWVYGAMIAVALATGFIIAFLVKKILRPLAPIAYPFAGGAAIFVMLTLIETQLGGGAGVIGGARTPLGVALQCGAGFAGGLVFAILRPRRS